MSSTPSGVLTPGARRPTLPGLAWWARQDLNLHGLLQRILSPSRLPIPPRALAPQPAGFYHKPRPNNNKFASGRAWGGRPMSSIHLNSLSIFIRPMIRGSRAGNGARGNRAHPDEHVWRSNVEFGPPIGKAEGDLCGPPAEGTESAGPCYQAAGDKEPLASSHASSAEMAPPCSMAFDRSAGSPATEPGEGW